MAQEYQLPAHLQNRQRRRLAETATDGIGGALPPHISIMGNEFTLIDAIGNEAADPLKTIDCVIADMSDVMCKMFYGHDWTPDSKDPPLCWSTNGIGPSRNAIQPQAPLCDGCPKHERGSAISKISGASIKACRDEKHLAVLLPAYPGMLFRLVVTPGSFKNWQAFTKPYEGSNVDITDVVVTVGFQPKVNGVLTFQAKDYASPADVEFCDQAVQAKATDALVGRNDVPISRALPAPEDAPRPLSTIPVASAPTAGFPSMPGAPPSTPTAPPVQAAFPSSLPAGQPATRKRRTKAEMEAARQETPQVAPPPQPAPFRPGVAPNGPAPQSAPFGISQGVPPNPEVAGMINSIFKTQ